MRLPRRFANFHLTTRDESLVGIASHHNIMYAVESVKIAAYITNNFLINSIRNAVLNSPPKDTLPKNLQTLAEKHMLSPVEDEATS